MKIAYYVYPEIVLSGKSNGVRGQAITWAKGLRKYGHEVIEINPWGNYDWISFDVIHVFGKGLWIHSFVSELYKKNKNIVISPIIDSNQSLFRYKLSTFLGAKKLRLWSSTYALKKTLPYVKGVFVRSDHESQYFSKAMNLNDSKIFKVSLSYEDIYSEQYDNVKKENFCLHISSIYQPRKNVLRLIQAAKKYKFNLVLAGAKGTEEQFAPIKKEIGTSKNIKVLGFISEEEMKDLFARAKVFALPSILEGVGIVALNAARFGCEIVITNIGGPKEYYKEMAVKVNPFSVDEIGSSVVQLLHQKGFQPKLKEYVKMQYSDAAITKMLVKQYLLLNLKE